ncbi:MAG: dockerin type I repeat-containing protein [bacterium]|nr:dockerin type I repeat-containing protein [bacterium]
MILTCRHMRVLVLMLAGMLIGTLLISATVTAGPQSVVPISQAPANKALERGATQNFSNQPAPKQPFHGIPNRPNRIAQGGDNIASATVISSLPYSDAGTTSGYNDDYDETCPYLAPGSPDVVYSYTPAANEVVDIDLCASGYDTKVYVYAGSYTPGSPYACNDDACPGFRSAIYGLNLTGGTTYYIVIDGYDGDFGSYQLEMIGMSPCTVTCPPGSIAEGEACVTDGDDTDNGGCNSVPEVYGSVNPGDVICGTSWSSADFRDTDWYLRSFTGDTTVHWTVVANFPVLVYIIDMNLGCSGAAGVISTSGDPCDTLVLDAILPAGDYAFFVSPSVFDAQYTCEAGTWNYTARLDAEDPPLAPANNNCVDATPIGDVVNLPFTTVSSTHDGPGACVFGANVWYAYTASCTGAARISLCGSSYDTKLAVYDGATCPPGTPIACNDDFCGVSSEATVMVTAGETYLIEIGGYDTEVGPGLLTVECNVLPPNNFCEDVTPVTLPATFNGDNTGAINQCAGFPDGHVWHAFTIDHCMDVTLDYCGTSPAFGNAWLNLAMGCPCDSFSFAGDFDVTTCGDGNVTIRWQALPAGTYYYPVLLDPANGAEGPYTINVSGDTVACRPCPASGGCDEFVQNVTVGTINQSSGCDGYADYTMLNTTMWKRLSYPISVTNGNPYSSDQCGIWVDWNGDTDFDDPYETVAVSGTPGNGPYTGVLIPPDSPGMDTVTLRVRITYTGAVDPCGETDYGEVEDYSLIIRHFECGDVDGDDAVNLTDVAALMSYYFYHGPAPIPMQRADANCDGAVNIADIVFLADYLYGGGPAPCCVP